MNLLGEQYGSCLIRVAKKVKEVGKTHVDKQLSLGEIDFLVTYLPPHA
jgi:hypothetical protein